MIQRLRRRTRQTLRLSSLGAHVALGVGIVLVVFPWLSIERRRAVQQGWARLLLAILGVRLAVRGGESAAGLLVANHISWLDVFVINAHARTTFVCKDEVRGWPVFGLLCARADTVFIDRGSRSAARRVNETIAARLGAGDRIAVFPEGTTSDGAGVMAFRAALLQPAIDAGHVLQPLALRYADRHGAIATEIAYAGETTMWQSLCAIAAAHDVTAHLAVLEAIPAHDLPRRELAEQAQTAIHAALTHTQIATKDIAEEEPDLSLSGELA